MENWSKFYEIKMQIDRFHIQCPL